MKSQGKMPVKAGCYSGMNRTIVSTRGRKLPARLLGKVERSGGRRSAADTTGSSYS